MAADVICKSYIEQLKFELNSISNNYEKARSHFLWKLHIVRVCSYDDLRYI